MWQHLDRIIDGLIVVGPLFIWALRWARRIDSTVGLTKQMATTHLPFIYGRLRAHDEALAIENPEHPQIGLLVNGDK